MTVGVDTYVTVAEADEIVRLMLRPYDEFLIFWSVLSKEEKESYLLRSTQQIDTLTLTGRKRDFDQSLQFPRNGEKEIPSAVKKAEVYNALGILNEDLKAESVKQMQVLKSLGAVKNLRLDQTSMRAIASAEQATTTEKKIPLESKTAYGLLKRFCCGGFRLA